MIDTIEVETDCGHLRGSTENGIATFRGVPFAAPPIGRLRFQPAQPIKPWASVKEAVSNGPICPQLPARLVTFMGPFSAPQDEDCLTLTIWSSVERSKARPVLVFLHGGGYSSGAGSLDWYSGEQLAREAGIVVVTVNYRLGALGYLHHPNIAPGNMGLSDQIEALRWITRNIAAFGGDPDQITLMGQSGGAHSILCMLAMPSAWSLVRRAILLSCPFGMSTIPAATARANATMLLTELGLDPDASGVAEHLQTLPVAAILTAQLDVMKRPLRPAGDPTPPFGPVATGELPGGTAFRTALFEAARHIDFIAGSTSDEMNSFYRQDPRLAGATPKQINELAGTLFGDSSDTRMKNAQAQLPPQADMLSAFCHAQNHHYFVEDSYALAEAITDANRKAWIYQFDWHPPGGKLGACHCIELPFVFGTFTAFREAPMIAGGGGGMDQRSALLRAALTRFVIDGDPNGPGLPRWPAFSGNQPAILHIGETFHVEAEKEQA